MTIQSTGGATDRPAAGRWAAAMAVAVLAVALGGAARACSVPVFRYALLWWGAHGPADCYQVVIFHRGPLSEQDAATVEQLRQGAWREGRGANYQVTTVDLAGQVSESVRKFWQGLEARSEPWVAVRYPPVMGIDRPVWSGPFDPQAVGRVLDSPVRREIGRRLMAGQTAVWVLLDSGRADRDEAAARLLGEQLEQLQKMLQLPDDAQDDAFDTPEDNRLEELAADQSLPEIRIEFSIIRVKARQDEELMLRRMLQRSEEDLEKQYADEPMAFPVFGRGRVLWGLVGGGINEQLIGEYCAYLVGMCSCQIKAQNPGFDLLMTTDWNRLFESDGQAQPVLIDQLPGTIEAPVGAEAAADGPAPASGAVATASSAYPATAGPSDLTATDGPTARPGLSRLAWSVIVAVVVGLVVVLVLVRLVQRRYAKT